MTVNKKIIQTIQQHKSFLLSTHVNPDPDALCSEMALALYLKSIGKKVLILNEDDTPERFQFLPGVKHIESFKKEISYNYDVAVILDCGDIDRIGKVRSCLNLEKPIINIDHHITNDKFGTINLVEPDASSTAEVLYELLTQAQCWFSRDIALHLYVGIMTDTGSFRYENTTAKTHAIIAQLMKFKFSAYDLYRKLYESMPVNDLKNFTKVISKFDESYEGKAVTVELKKNFVSKFSGDFDLRDSIFKFLRAIKGLEVIAIFTEISKKETRVNLRSAKNVNVAAIAHHFSGGGHRRASGCVIEANMKQAREQILRAIGKELKWKE
jgi:phosphoesterase RecJ-like protein